MTTLPIPANTAEHLYCRQLPAASWSFDYEELMRVKALAPAWTEWVEKGRIAQMQASLEKGKSLTPDQKAKAAAVYLTDLNNLFPYMVAWYPTPTGWLCTSRRYVEPRTGIPERLLDAASCWEGATPAKALLSMMEDRFAAKEMRYNGAGYILVQSSPVMLAAA